MNKIINQEDNYPVREVYEMHWKGTYMIKGKRLHAEKNIWNIYLRMMDVESKNEQEIFPLDLQYDAFQIPTPILEI